jgi:antitoxin YefM
MKTMTASSVRANFAATLAEVADKHERIIIHRPNGKSVMIVSLEDVSQMDTTDYLLASPLNRERLLSSVKDMQAGVFEAREISQ